MPDRGEVHADLVRATRLEVHGLERVLGKRLAQLKVRDGRARANTIDRAARAVGRITANRRVDPPRNARWAPMDERDIFALNLTVAHHPLQRIERLLVARNDKQSRGLLVEAVDNARTILFSPARQAARRQHAGERRARRPGRGMRDETNRLINDDEIVVLIEDRRLEDLGHLLHNLLKLRLVDRDYLTTLDARAAGLGLAVNRDVAVVDQTLRGCPRQARNGLMHDLVEPRTGVLGVDDDLDHARC